MRVLLPGVGDVETLRYFSDLLGHTRVSLGSSFRHRRRQPALRDAYGQARCSAAPAVLESDLHGHGLPGLAQGTGASSATGARRLTARTASL